MNPSGRLFAMILGVSACLGLSGCFATTDQIEAEQAVLTASEKEKKLLNDGPKVNNYINRNVPSQVRHSVGLLTAEQEPQVAEAEFPPIEDLSQPTQPLKSKAEQDQLRQELELLLLQNQ